jgi:hypothetical protein
MRAILVIFVVFTVAPILAIADTIHGCVDKRTGRLRIVGVAGQCRDREVPISWNAEGAPVPAPQKFALVGFTASTVEQEPIPPLPGVAPTVVAIGVFAMTEVCKAEFPDSRVCTLTELLETPVLPTFSDAATDWAWFNEGLDGCMRINWPGQGTGNVVSKRGMILAGDCGVLRSVACCAPAQ